MACGLSVDNLHLLPAKSSRRRCLCCGGSLIKGVENVLVRCWPAVIRRSLVCKRPEATFARLSTAVGNCHKFERFIDSFSTALIFSTGLVIFTTLV